MSRKNHFSAATTEKLKVVLDDLCVRFLVNLPAVEYESFERLFFAIESAHWFYDDFFRANDPALPRLLFKQFAAKIFGHTALLNHHKHEVDTLTAQFQAYKQKVPTCGAALLDSEMEKVVLVRAWGNNARWGFPKGKLSKDETELDCAIREVLEETGFDMTDYVNGDTFFVDTISSGRYCRIFVVTDVPKDTVFETRTRKEISDIKWVRINSLPEALKAAQVQHRVLLTSTGRQRTSKEACIYFSYYGVAPYTKKIRSWIGRRRKNLEEHNGTPAVSSAYVYGKKWKPCEPDHIVAGLPAGGAISVEELEASLLVTPSEPPIVQNNPSQSKNENRKSRRQMEKNEQLRNRATFGETAGMRMNNVERDDLSLQYVIATDRIAAENGLCDDLWPVPYVTSKDFSEEQRRKAEEARRKRERNVVSNDALGMVVSPPSLDREGNIRSRIYRMKVGKVLPHVDTPPFVFDRDAVLASMDSFSSF